MNTVTIKKANSGDLYTIQQIGRETFLETFRDYNTQEDMEIYLENSFNDHQMIAELNNADSAFYIAWADNIPIGYLKVNTGLAQTEQQDEKALEIERIYVKSNYHGKEVGQLLLKKALELAQEGNRTYLWLGVWEENRRALRFYEKNGFVAFGKHIFKMGKDEQIDIMMKKILQ